MSPKKVTKVQKEALVNFMNENYTFLFGKFSNISGKTAKEKKWKELCDVLNSHGPPVKDIEKWKRTWADAKMKTKEKVKQIRQHRNRTGGGPPINLQLSPLEDRIFSICGTSLMDGDENLDEVGFGYPKKPNDARPKTVLQPSIENVSNDQCLMQHKLSKAADNNCGSIIFIDEDSCEIGLEMESNQMTNESVRSARKRLFSEIEPSNDSVNSCSSGFLDVYSNMHLNNEVLAPPLKVPKTPSNMQNNVTPPSSRYNSQHNQVERALALQQQTNELLAQMIGQNREILREIKQIGQHFGEKK